MMMWVLLVRWFPGKSGYGPDFSGPGPDFSGPGSGLFRIGSGLAPNSSNKIEKIFLVLNIS